MRILGIDPGTGRTGFGVIDLDQTKLPPKSRKNGLSFSLSASLVDYGCIETAKELPMPKRLIEIRTAIQNALKRYKPDAVSIELLFFGINSRTAMTVGQARGVVLETVAEANIPIFEYQGLMVKRVISGSGKADKKAVQEIMKTFFQLEQVPKPDDAADGLAIALCHALTLQEKANG